MCEAGCWQVLEANKQEGGVTEWGLTQTSLEEVCCYCCCTPAWWCCGLPTACGCNPINQVFVKIVTKAEEEEDARLGITTRRLSRQGSLGRAVSSEGAGAARRPVRSGLSTEKMA